MIPVKKILRRYEESGEANSVLAPCRFLDEHCFLNKTGSIGVFLTHPGMDSRCVTDQDMLTYSRRFDAALKPLDEPFRIYQYAVKRSGVKIQRSERYPNDKIRSAVETRSAYLENLDGGLYEIDLYTAILYETSLFSKKNLRFSAKKMIEVIASDVARDVGILTAKAEAFAREINDFVPARLMDKNEVFRFLRYLGSLDIDISGGLPLSCDNHVDCFLMDRRPSVSDGSLSIGRSPVEVLVMREVPKETNPDFFRSLYALPCDLILCTEFQTVSRIKASKEIAGAQSHHNYARYLKDPISALEAIFTKKTDNIVPDKGASDNVDELGELSRKLNNGDVLGRMNCVLMLHGRDKRDLRLISTDATKLFGRYGSSMIQETDPRFSLLAYLGMFPGGHFFNELRSLWYTRGDYSDMALIYSQSHGEVTNKFLRSEYLFAATTSDKTPVYVNMHHNDVCNVLVSGVMGSGKSVFSNLCLESLVKYGAHVCVMDIGGSYKQTCRRYDGSYLHFDFEKQSFFVNPFSLPGTLPNQRSSVQFLRILFGTNGYELTLDDKKNLHDAVREIYTHDDQEYRRLGNLKLKSHLRKAISNWIGNGEDAWLFDNSKDTVTCNQVQVYDFQGYEAEEYANITVPLMFYLFRRQTMVVQDTKLRGTFKMMWVDEAHHFLANEICRSKFIAAGKTYRKHNAGICLTTQSAVDLRQAGFLELANETFPTKVFLNNPGSDIAEYARVFHLNDKEVERFSTLAPKRDVMIKKGEKPAQVFEVHVSPEELAMYANSTSENMMREEMIDRYGFEEGIKAFAAQIGNSR